MPMTLFYSELNNMGIWYRMGNVPRAQDSTHTPTTNNIQNVNSSTVPAPIPAAPMPKYVHSDNFVHKKKTKNKQTFFQYKHTQNVSF